MTARTTKRPSREGPVVHEAANCGVPSHLQTGLGRFSRLSSKAKITLQWKLLKPKVILCGWVLGTIFATGWSRLCDWPSALT